MTRHRPFPPSFIPWALCLGIATQAAFVHPLVPRDGAVSEPATSPHWLPPLPIEQRWFASPSNDELVAARGLRIDHGPTGARLARVPPESLLRHLGFETGDLVTAVADVPLDTAEAMVAAGRRARTLQAFVVEFERGGESWARPLAWVTSSVAVRGSAETPLDAPLPIPREASRGIVGACSGAAS